MLYPKPKRAIRLDNLLPSNWMTWFYTVEFGCFELYSERESLDHFLGEKLYKRWFSESIFTQIMSKMGLLWKFGVYFRFTLGIVEKSVFVGYGETRK